MSIRGCIIRGEDDLALHKKIFGNNKRKIAKRYIAYEIGKERLEPSLIEAISKYGFDEALITTCFFRYSHYDDYEGYLYTEVDKPGRGVMEMWSVPNAIIKAWQDITNSYFKVNIF